MPHVVIDTSVTLPATLSPTGMARKLWVLLALGALEHQVEQRRLERQELQAEAATTNASAFSPPSAGAEQRANERRRTVLRELLPDDAPAGWVALGSTVLFDEYERKVREIGRRLNPRIRERDFQPLRRQVEAICLAACPPFKATQAPKLTRDRKDDPIVYTALLGHADYLISDDRDIVPNGIEQSYEHDEHQVLAVTFHRFVTTHFEPLDLDWSAIDGRWLGHAFNDPRPST